MPAPAESELPRLHREYEAMRLRNQLDPKRFYRKDEGEGKGTKGLPKYFAVCSIFTTASNVNPHLVVRSVKLLQQDLLSEIRLVTIFLEANANER